VGRILKDYIRPSLRLESAEKHQEFWDIRRWARFCEFLDVVQSLVHLAKDELVTTLDGREELLAACRSSDEGRARIEGVRFAMASFGRATTIVVGLSADVPDERVVRDLQLAGDFENAVRVHQLAVASLHEASTMIDVAAAINHRLLDMLRESAFLAYRAAREAQNLRAIKVESDLPPRVAFTDEDFALVDEGWADSERMMRDEGL
jgi:hypothetical protein